MNHDLKDFLAQLLNGQDLTEDQSEELMTALAAGSVEQHWQELYWSL